MQFFICVILYLCLFIKYSSSNYIECTSKCSQITVSFNESLTIPFTCQENTNISESALVCLVEYRIIYDAKIIYITFKASNETNIFKNQEQSEYLTQGLWLAFNQEANQPNLVHRTYRCNTKNDCARQYYLNTIKYLITNGKLELDKISLNLYNDSLSTSQSTRRRCKDTNKKGNNTLTRCRKGLCYAHNTDKKQYCTSDTTPTFFSEFEYHLPISTMNKREVIEYKCNIDLCNGNRMIDKIKKILYDYTNWNNYVKIEPEVQEQPVEAKSSSRIDQIISYYLIVLSLIKLRFLF